LLDTREALGKGADLLLRGGDTFQLEGRSLVLFRLRGANGNGEQPAARPKRKTTPQQG
jgi:hypothetical protein